MNWMKLMVHWFYSKTGMRTGLRLKLLLQEPVKNRTLTLSERLEERLQQIPKASGQQSIWLGVTLGLLEHLHLLLPCAIPEPRSYEISFPRSPPPETDRIGLWEVLVWGFYGVPRWFIHAASVGNLGSRIMVLLAEQPQESALEGLRSCTRPGLTPWSWLSVWSGFLLHFDKLLTMLVLLIGDYFGEAQILSPELVVKVQQSASHHPGAEASSEESAG